jgi:hypothetical protein
MRNASAVPPTLDDFAPEQRTQLRRASTPARIQRLLDSMTYNLEPLGRTCSSPRVALERGSAHCLEGAFIAAAALRLHRRPPLVLDLEAERDDDHVVAVFREPGGWGAIAKSNFSGLRYRAPVYRTLRELALSYYEHYFNLRGERTLRRYSLPVNLARFDAIQWMTAATPLWDIPRYLVGIRHFELLPRSARPFTRVDARSFAAGLLGHSH